MAQTIKLKRSSVSGNVPSTGQLELGELAINTHDGKVFIKKDDGTASIVEVGLSTPTASVYSKYTYTATASQTTFSGTDDSSNSLSYFPGYAEVYLNGVKLLDTTEYTATNGSSIVLAAGASADDVLEVIAMGSGSLEQLIVTRGFDSFIYTATASQTTFSGTDDNSNSLSYTANQIQVFLNGVLLDPSDYTASNGTSVVISSGTTADDIVTILAYNVDSLDSLGDLSVDGNITVSGTVDGRDIATDGTKLDGIESGATADQTATEILTAIKTVDGAASGLDADLLDGQQGSYYTSYTDTAISNLVDSAPGALDTLNELAAALGDDANFSTTVTNSIALKAPLASPTFTGTVTIPAATVTGDVSFGDNDKAVFGAGNDLQIYHDGSNSYIKDTGTGRLALQSSSDFLVSNTANTQNYIYAQESGYVRLYYSGSTKLATTATGIDVTGTATMGEISVSGPSSTGTLFHGLTIASTTNASGATTEADIRLGTTSAYGVRYARIEAYEAANDTYQNGLKFYTNNSASADSETLALTIAGNGDISFYEDTGTTPKFFWDASAERLNLGDSASPRGGAFSRMMLAETTAGDINWLEIQSSTTGRTGVIFSDGSSGNYGLVDYDHTDDHLKIFTASVERLRIDSNGSLAVGTGGGITATGAKAQFNSNGNAANLIAAFTNENMSFNTAAGAYITIGDGGTASRSIDIGINTDGAGESDGSIVVNEPGGSLDLGVANSTQAVRINSSGNVGIGTTSPSLKFHVNGGASNTLALFESTDAGAAISFKDGNTTINPEVDCRTNDLAFNTNNTERLRIDSSGNVGIGTSSPSVKISSAIDTSTEWSSSANLSNATNIPIYAALFENNDTSITGSEVNVLFSAGGAGSGQHSIGVKRTGLNSGDLIFRRRSDPAASRETMRIDSSGNVGIGTSSPSSYNAVADNLVIGTTSGSNGLTIVAGTGNDGSIHFADGTSGADAYRGQIYYSHAGNYMVFGTNATERMRIDASGNLLVGKTSTSSTTAGTHLNPNGKITTTRSSGPSAAFVRLSSDGSIVDFQKDGTTVGSIGVGSVPSTDRCLTIGKSDSGILFDNVGNRISPWNMNTNAVLDNSINLGYSGGRFKDAHFSGTVNANAFSGDGSGLTGVGGGGAWTKLNTYNLSSGTNSFSAPSLLDTTTYSRFVIIIDDVILTSPYSRHLYLSLTGNDGSTYADSIKWTSMFERSGNAIANSAAVTQITVTDSPAVISKGLFNIEITKPINSRVKGEINGGYEGVNYGHCTIRGSSYWNLSTLTGFQITVDSPATFSSGTITVYGVE